jgi:hypothetical protein
MRNRTSQRDMGRSTSTYEEEAHTLLEGLEVLLEVLIHVLLIDVDFFTRIVLRACLLRTCAPHRMPPVDRQPTKRGDGGGREGEW